VVPLLDSRDVARPAVVLALALLAAGYELFVIDVDGREARNVTWAPDRAALSDLASILHWSAATETD
jgi:hypothetical protein